MTTEGINPDQRDWSGEVESCKTVNELIDVVLSIDTDLAVLDGLRIPAATICDAIRLVSSGNEEAWVFISEEYGIKKTLRAILDQKNDREPFPPDDPKVLKAAKELPIPESEEGRSGSTGSSDGEPNSPDTPPTLSAEREAPEPTEETITEEPVWDFAEIFTDKTALTIQLFDGTVFRGNPIAIVDRTEGRQVDIAVSQKTAKELSGSDDTTIPIFQFPIHLIDEKSLQVIEASGLSVDDESIESGQVEKVKMVFDSFLSSDMTELEMTNGHKKRAIIAGCFGNGTVLVIFPGDEIQKWGFEGSERRRYFHLSDFTTETQSRILKKIRGDKSE